MALFVAAEGIDHSGKTTLVQGLCQRLHGDELRVGAFKEPSTGAIGNVLRELSTSGEASARTLALLSAADRHHQQPALRRLLDSADVVVADRYYLSGLAYHFVDGVDPTFYDHCAGGVVLPDLYLYLDVAVDVAAARVERPPDSKWERSAFMTSLPGAYQRCIDFMRAERGATVVRLDARQSASRLLTDAVDLVSDRLQRHRRAAA